MTDTIAVLVCRVGKPASLERIDPELDAMQAIVGGDVQVITLDDGVDLWCNEDALALKLPLNRCIPTTGRIPRGFEVVIDMTHGQSAKDGEPGEWRIHGDFFLALAIGGEIVSLTTEDIAKYQVMFDAQDAASDIAKLEAAPC